METISSGVIIEHIMASTCNKGIKQVTTHYIGQFVAPFWKVVPIKTLPDYRTFICKCPFGFLFSSMYKTFNRIKNKKLYNFLFKPVWIKFCCFIKKFYSVLIELYKKLFCVGSQELYSINLIFIGMLNFV